MTTMTKEIPSTKMLVKMVKSMKKSDVKHIFPKGSISELILDEEDNVFIIFKGQEVCLPQFGKNLHKVWCNPLV